jgi:hypothetical protein
VQHVAGTALAGDTHDFEYYRETIAGDGAARAMHHFVNGGSGAYLSIDTALDFAKPPAVGDWAFYPRTDRLRAKMDVEMPVWKHGQQQVRENAADDRCAHHVRITALVDRTINTAIGTMANAAEKKITGGGTLPT